MNPAYAPPPGLMYDETFRKGFACLAPLNLSFDAWLYHPQIGDVTALAQAFPGTPICLNHVGGPLAIGAYAGKRAEVLPTGRSRSGALAACPNVVVKLGGMAMRINGWDFHTKAEPPSSEELAAAWKPYVETCIEAFGADRCMFESNFPVDKGSYGYAAFWNACKILAKGASAAEKTDLVQRDGGAVLSPGDLACHRGGIPMAGIRAAGLLRCTHDDMRRTSLKESIDANTANRRRQHHQHHRAGRTLAHPRRRCSRLMTRRLALDI